MTGDELIGEGRRIARPCVYLVNSPSQSATVCAIWGGSGVVAPPAGHYKHWLSVDSSVLPEGIGTMSGVLSIYSDEDDYETGAVAIDHSIKLPSHGTAGLVLFAEPAISMPPIDA